MVLFATKRGIFFGYLIRKRLYYFAAELSCSKVFSLEFLIWLFMNYEIFAIEFSLLVRFMRLSWYRVLDDRR